MSDLYRNPFSDVNASQLEEYSILEYWCNPFTYKLFSGIKERDVYQDKNNIVFMGGRSTGKSMFLRYWSYEVQQEAARKNNSKLVDFIKEKKGIGFYLRIDGPVLRSFQENNLSNEHWASVFTHYFELLIGRQFIELLKILQDEKSIVPENINDIFLPKLCEHLDFQGKTNLTEIIEEFDKRISEIDRFRGDVAFYKEPFKPLSRAFGSQSITFGVAKLIKNYIPLFKNINIVILLDEYENFLEYQQIIINTLLKFTKPQIKFRIGMRLEGFRTFSTISSDDFIKEGREYRKVVFEEVLVKDTGYHQFLVEIAKKRLESVPLLKSKGLTDIKAILTEREDLEAEALNLVSDSPDRVYNFFANSLKIPKKDLDLVRYVDNPLMELMNFIWLLRGVSANETFKAMTDYLNKKQTKEGKKYKMDYVDKYKLSLMFLLCTIYRKRKKYYSFNTFAFLSSGIVGHFIELCRRTFAFAEWGNEIELKEHGRIDSEFQSSAANEFSISEKRQINRIEEYGGRISRFVENIGNIFRDWHRDLRMRYPETTQFAVNIDALENNELKMAMKSAIKWSVIQTKPRMQRSAPGEQLEDLYTLNRIFSPTFQISYRTRGGKNLLLSEENLSELMSEEQPEISKYLLKDASSDKESTEAVQPYLPNFYE